MGNKVMGGAHEEVSWGLGRRVRENEVTGVTGERGDSMTGQGRGDKSRVEPSFCHNRQDTQHHTPVTTIPPSLPTPEAQVRKVSPG